MLEIKYLQECINLELTVGENLCSFIVPYRSPSQTHDDFENFMKHFELNIDKINKKNPFLFAALGDLNAKSQTLYEWQKHRTNGPTLMF